MQIILRQDINKLGKVGDIIKVKDGYARNFLIPKGVAIEATNSNLKFLEEEKRQKSFQAEKKKAEAVKYADKINGTSCTVIAEAMEDERLYGHITPLEVVNALDVEGIKVSKDDIHFENPIDKLGIFEVGISVHKDVMAKVKVWVTRK